MTTPKLTVYFDGACHLCSREISHYRKKDLLGALHLVDISDPKFDAAAEGLDAAKLQKTMHARLPSGELVNGVPAFIEIWRVLPGFGGMAKVAASPVLTPFLRVGYAAFAAIRPYLPKRKRQDCETGACAV